MGQFQGIQMPQIVPPLSQTKYCLVFQDLMGILHARSRFYAVISGTSSDINMGSSRECL